MTLPADIAKIEDRHRRDIERLWSHRSEDVGIGAHTDRATLLRAYRELAQENMRLTTTPADHPLASEINALPQRLRQYVHDLETRCDPSGDVVTIFALRENLAGAELHLNRLRASHAKLRAVLDQALTQLIDNDTADTDDLISVGNAIRDALADAQHPEQQPAGEKQ